MTEEIRQNKEEETKQTSQEQLEIFDQAKNKRPNDQNKEIMIDFNRTKFEEISIKRLKNNKIFSIQELEAEESNINNETQIEKISKWQIYKENWAVDCDLLAEKCGCEEPCPMPNPLKSKEFIYILIFLFGFALGCLMTYGAIQGKK